MIWLTYASQKHVRDAKTNAILSFVSAFLSFFPSNLRPLLAILALVTGVLGMVFGVKQKRWAWFVLALFGLFFGLITSIMLLSGEEF